MLSFYFSITNYSQKVSKIFTWYLLKIYKICYCLRNRTLLAYRGVKFYDVPNYTYLLLILCTQFYRARKMFSAHIEQVNCIA